MAFYPRLEVLKKRKDAVIPTKAHPGDAGYDLTILSVYKEFSPNLKLYDTGISVAPSTGYYTEIHARSSLAKQGYMLSNGIGIIDTSYRGNLLVSLYKFDPNAPDIELPARVAQLIPRKHDSLIVREVESLDETERGEGGFGSTDGGLEGASEK